MYAIVEIAGLQYKVEKDQQLYVNRLQEKEGDVVNFNKVLLTDNGSVTVGAPVIDGVAVQAKILEHVKGDKVIVFKKKRRKGYKKKNGHRQQFTKLEVVSISIGGKATKEKTEQKKTVKKEDAKNLEKDLKEEKKSTEVSASEDLTKLTVSELRTLAKEKGLEGFSSMKKVELIEALSK